MEKDKKKKLAAAFWHFHHYFDHRDSSSSPPPPPNMRHGKAAVVKENGLDFSHLLRDPSPPHHRHKPESAGSLRRQIGQVLIKHHQSIERNNHALQPVSPASFGSSLEVETYNKAVTPSSSLERPSREPHYNLKTSTELLKVLNRIWSLEEQHATNISLIKALKTELAHSRAQIKELLRYQQADRHDLEGVVKQLTEEKLLKKNKEVERMSSAAQSMRRELENERKLRKRSESMHRKMAREVLEEKSICMKEIERGNKSKKMMEILCDEFAKGIKSYKEEIHCLKQKNLDKDWEDGEERDHIVLHLAESWLDERMHMRLEDTLNGKNSNSVLDKLGVEIEAFFQAKQSENPRNLRNSLESVQGNALSEPPRDVECEEESVGSQSYCFELKKPDESHVDETEKLNKPNKDNLLDERPKEKVGSESSFQVKFKDQMAWEMSSNGKKKTPAIEEEEEHAVNSKSKKQEDEVDECVSTTNKNDMMGEMIRTHRRLLSETHELDAASCSYPSSRRQASPIRQWTSRTVTPDIVQSSYVNPQGVKDNTLKTRLAKSSKPRLRLFKG
ncbi:unnamed protein product [Cochlearia groenlandica]